MKKTGVHFMNIYYMQATPSKQAVLSIRFSAFDFRVPLSPFVFCLLPFAFILLFSSCKFNPAIQGKGSDFLQGEWQQDTVLYKDKLLEYTGHHFTFTCDSFYATLNTVSKVNRLGSDVCFGNGNWTEYAKGTYTVSNDSLYVRATFTQSNFKQKISGCYRIGQYLPIFIIQKYSENTIQLLDLHRHLPLILRLKNKIKCIPKPL